MDTTFFYKNLSTEEEKNFLAYAGEKLEAISGLLTTFAKDAQLLKISIEKFNKHDAFEVELCLNLPTKRLISKEASHAFSKAMDQSKDRMLLQIKKHMAQLRKDRAHSSIRQGALYRPARLKRWKWISLNDDKGHSENDAMQGNKEIPT